MDDDSDVEMEAAKTAEELLKEREAAAVARGEVVDVADACSQDDAAAPEAKPDVKPDVNRRATPKSCSSLDGRRGTRWSPRRARA